MLTPALLGSLVPPGLLAALPVSIGQWAIGHAVGLPVSVWTPIGWLAALAVFPLGGVLLFGRQEL